MEFIKRFNKLYNNLPKEIKHPQATAKVVFAGAFKSEFRFTLRERKSASLDQIQTDALEVEANFTSTGKSKGRTKNETRSRGKEEASSSNQEWEASKYKIEKMNKMIKNLSNKLVKLELEAKNSSPRPNMMAPNRGFNPQYQKPSLQILQQDKKEQQDHIQTLI